MTSSRTRKTLSDAERAEVDAERDARIAEIKDNFDARLAKIATDPEAWAEFLTTVADFGARYSVGNQMLLLWQAEQRGVTPQYFQPYGQYKWVADPERPGKKIRDYDQPVSGWVAAGRHVRKGEKSYQVLAPRPVRYTEADAAKARAAGKKVSAGDVKFVSFTLVPTFELSQTEGEDFVVPSIEIRRRELVGQTAELLEGDDPTGAFDDVVKLIKDLGYSFDLVAPGTGLLSGPFLGANGVTSRQGSQKQVQVRNDVSGAQRVKTAVHELAHIELGHLDESGHSEHRGQRETEAESVAHIVCGALGLPTETYSDAYVLGWAGGDMKLVEKVAKHVLTVAKKILSGLDPATDRDEA